MEGTITKIMTREDLIKAIEDSENWSDLTELAELEAECWKWLNANLSITGMNKVRREILDSQYTLFDAVYNAGA